jgi:hypothetical protein
MKRLSLFAMAIGASFAAMSLLLPTMLRCLAASALKPYGGEQYASEIATLQMEELGIWPVVFRVHYGLCIVAGFLMMMEKAFGRYLWLVLCIAFIPLDVACVWTDPWDRGTAGIVGVLIRDLWWSVVFVISYRVLARMTVARPNQSPEPTPAAWLT